MRTAIPGRAREGLGGADVSPRMMREGSSCDVKYSHSEGHWSCCEGNGGCCWNNVLTEMRSRMDHILWHGTMAVVARGVAVLRILVLGRSTEVLPERRETFGKPNAEGGGKLHSVANCFFFLWKHWDASCAYIILSHRLQV